MSYEPSQFHSIQSNQGDAVSPWSIEGIVPTTLIALWSGDSMPTKTEVVAALQQQCDKPIEPIDELDGGGDDVQWNGVFQLPLASSPVIFWSEPAKKLSPGELDDLAEVQKCKWAVGAEFELGGYEEYIAMLRALARATSSPAILDPISMRWWVGQALDDLRADPPAEPPLDSLWTIHAVSDHEQDRDGCVWLHTHGLWRCNRPELEMLEVPQSHFQAAASLMNEIAAGVLESDPPAPGEIMHIGLELSVTLQPWQVVAEHVDPENTGGMKDREGEDNPHAGVRAVICAPKPKGVFRRLWVWPEEAVRRFDEDDAVIFRTTVATQRQARLAQQRWSDLAMAFAHVQRRRIPSAKPDDPPCFIVKTALETNDPESPEHVWVLLMQIRGDQATGRLLNQPINVAAMKEGDTLAVDKSSISDWLAILPSSRFGPGALPALWRAIRQMDRGGSG